MAPKMYNIQFNFSANYWFYHFCRFLSQGKQERSWSLNLDLLQDPFL